MAAWSGPDGIVGGLLESALRGCRLPWGGLSPHPPACSLVGGRGETPGARGGVLAARWSSGTPGRVFQGGLVAKRRRCRLDSRLGGPLWGLALSWPVCHPPPLSPLVGALRGGPSRRELAQNFSQRWMEFFGSSSSCPEADRHWQCFPVEVFLACGSKCKHLSDPPCPV